MIKFYDKTGKEFEITKNEYIKKVLPVNIKEAWNKSDALYNLIVMSLNDEIYEEILDSCKQLYKIDYDKLRKTTVLGICYMKLKQYNNAKELFEDYINKNGKEPIILVNYAKVITDIKGLAEGEKILHEALLIDPNMDNGLEWWGAIHFEEGGNNLYIKSMKELAELKNSWRPQLWIARFELENKNINSALNYYKIVLQRFNNNQDALMQISGDLGNNGYLQEIIDVIIPVYDPQKHGPYTGINLLQTYLNLKNKKDGEKLLNKLKELRLYEITQYLDYYEKEFNKTK